ncbi:hypothetical protein HU200_021457 [Digitaria exilis]|uniref:Uncharacterized protein n=1 Tax=Digitaria exilis TaxID=1010633 RepID=A0A835EZ49_9POAL|nr:hypothetical protein HU200_021457 [Digitaria exilis]CAB3467548.1 unnamed protein product [Digitaria exilis]
MLRLRNHLLPLVRGPASQLTSPIHHGGFRRLLSTSPSPTPFSFKDYLVATCGLAPAQARSASKKALADATAVSKKAFDEFSTSGSGLNPRFDPDAVLALLSGVGLSRADIADVVAADPTLLLCRANRLEPRILALRDRVGLSPPEIARFLLVGSSVVRRVKVDANVEFLISFYGSFGRVLVALKRNLGLLTSSIEKMIKPNIALLHQCGLSARDIAQLCSQTPRLLSFNPKRVKEFLLRAEGLGVPRTSPMFKYAVSSVAYTSKENVAARLQFFKRTLGCSASEVSIAVSKCPYILGFNEENLLRKIEFLINEVRLEPQYIVKNPTLFTLNLEKRLISRYRVMKVLQETGLISRDKSFYTLAVMAEKTFELMFIDRHKDSVPGLADAYAAARAGSMS